MVKGQYTFKLAARLSCHQENYKWPNTLVYRSVFTEKAQSIQLERKNASVRSAADRPAVSITIFHKNEMSAERRLKNTVYKIRPK